ncbi:MAG: class I mannose-6-phosphate isomerase [Ruminococcus flavefaciens]|nr:class I mannose-6-phosphate isomerase [Ruminococcus flavefaciens]MCM1229540.1 class I mannose-6-phosphate isomerase [Ruminococcus flavefaciens]
MIFKLKAPVKDYIWGGTRLSEEYNKPKEGETVAESWELSCHHDGLSIIDGMDIPLVEYLAEHPEAMGENCRKFDDFPILIKLIDARDNLSVQVHPNEKYAQEHEGEHGKTEMWYIIDCEPDSSIIYGFRDKISKKDFRQAIENNTLLDKLNVVPVHKGDVFLIRAGTLHAIGKGCLIAEIQQSSNVTYRVYDYNRGRELHIDKALDVTQRTSLPAPEQNHEKNLLAECEYFKVYKEDIKRKSKWHKNEKSFTHILILDGYCEIISFYGDGYAQLYSAGKGDSFFLEAGDNWYIKGRCSVIYTTI